MDCRWRAAEPADRGCPPPGVVIQEGTGPSVPLHCREMMEQNPVGFAFPPAETPKGHPPYSPDTPHLSIQKWRLRRPEMISGP